MTIPKYQNEIETCVFYVKKMSYICTLHVTFGNTMEIEVVDFFSKCTGSRERKHLITKLRRGGREIISNAQQIL